MYIEDSKFQVFPFWCPLDSSKLSGFNSCGSSTLPPPNPPPTIIRLNHYLSFNPGKDINWIDFDPHEVKTCKNIGRLHDHIYMEWISSFVPIRLMTINGQWTDLAE